VLVTKFSRQALAVRKEKRDMLDGGWEFIGEGGYPLGELNRGARWRERIVEAKPSCDGKGVWVRIEKPAA